MSERPVFAGIAVGGPMDGKEIRLGGRFGRYREEGRTKGAYTFDGRTWQWQPLESAAERAKRAGKVEKPKATR